MLLLLLLLLMLLLLQLLDRTVKVQIKKTGAFVRHLHLVQPTARVRQRVRQRLGLLCRRQTDGPEHSPTSAGRGLLRPRRHREPWGVGHAADS